MGTKTQERAARFEVYKDRQKQYRWRFRAADGGLIADSSAGHNEKADCLEEIELVRQEALGAEMIDPTVSSDAKQKPRKGGRRTVKG
jgi:uncharacterized protein YegP (UPF0339 family)